MAARSRVRPVGREPDAGGAARKALCERIAACPTALKILQYSGASLSPEDLRCAPVVLSQLMHEDCPPAFAGAARWLVPEPWNGLLGEAPLLFIGQNPSASFDEAYPSLGDTAGTIDLHAYFEARFADAIADGTRVLLKDNPGGRTHGRANPFLKDVLRIATCLHQRAPIPGVDYALTEGVRCKSKDAIGAHLAVGPCARRYMRETLALSPARVIVCLGGVARDALLAAFGHDQASRKTLPALAFNTAVPLSVLDGSSVDRQVLFLSHPGSFRTRQAIDEEIIARLRAALAPRSA